MAGRGSRTRRGGPARLDLRGPQRTRYLRLAVACFGVAVAPAVFVLGSGGAGVEDLTSPVIWAVLLSMLAGYYLRVAFGWVQIGPAGLRTSRLWRGRHLPWQEITGLDTTTWYGKGSDLTVARIHLRSGRTYYLPAPRTTTPATAATFDRQFRQLRRHVTGRGAGTR
jgi:hypothetical protein